VTSPPGGAQAGSSPGIDPGAALVVSRLSSRMRKELRPMAWTVLEEVALDAVDEDGRLVARTSARRVADQLGVDPTTAAGALRVLRQQGLLTLERQSGPAGRFGLSLYVLGSVSGMTVIPACMDSPHMVVSHLVSPDVEGSDMAGADLEQPGPEEPHMEKLPARRRAPVPKLGPGSSAAKGQGALDLGLGTA
jgi:DNA-binding transcriptional ArsR family regulator